MITSTGALILLVPALPIAVWATLNDLKRLKIPNKAALAMAAIWPLAGWLAVPTWTAWFWGLGFLVIGIILAYVAFALANFPGGDGKYAAAISPFFVGADIMDVVTIVLICMVGATLMFQIIRILPGIDRVTPGWEGFKHWRIVPFGLALSAMVIYYLVAASWPQV